MSNIPNINNSLPYVPAGPNRERTPQERVIVSVEKQDASVHRLVPSRPSTQGPLSEKVGFENATSEVTLPGPNLAYPKEEPAVNTGLVFIQGQLVQEARDPVTGRVLERHPKVGCAQYEKVSSSFEHASEDEVKQAS